MGGRASGAGTRRGGGKEARLEGREGGGRAGEGATGPHARERVEGAERLERVQRAHGEVRRRAREPSSESDGARESNTRRARRGGTLATSLKED